MAGPIRPEERVAVFDPFSGISGDMILGAWADLGLAPEWIAEVAEQLQVPLSGLRAERVDRAGLAATRISFRLGRGDGVASAEADRGGHGAAGGPSAAGRAHGADRTHTGSHAHAGSYTHTASHAHPGTGPARRWADIRVQIERSSLPDRSRELALAAFARLAAAEGRVHGTTPDEVHFHEVGAADAIVDICAAADGFVRLGIAAAATLPVATGGGGTVRIAHGDYPLPAPATAFLLEGLPVRFEGSDELVTPTGAALLAELTGGRTAPAETTVEGVGYGAGARNPDARPNCLRVWLVRSGPDGRGATEILQADVDDMSPEYIPALVDACLEAGARDATVHAVHMKKGRPAWRLECVLEPEWRDSVQNAMFRHSTTLGLRGWRVERRVLFRGIEERVWRGHVIRVKRARNPADPQAPERVKPEFDDVAAAAAAVGWDPIRVLGELRREWPDLA